MNPWNRKNVRWWWRYRQKLLASAIHRPDDVAWIFNFQAYPPPEKLYKQLTYIIETREKWSKIKYAPTLMGKNLDKCTQLIVRHGQASLLEIEQSISWYQIAILIKKRHGFRCFQFQMTCKFSFSYLVHLGNECTCMSWFWLNLYCRGIKSKKCYLGNQMVTTKAALKVQSVAGDLTYCGWAFHWKNKE